MPIEKQDPHGQAIFDFAQAKQSAPLWVNNKLGEAEEMPVDIFFRSFEQFTELEQTAIENCKGVVLDIGAGAGCASIALQDKGFEVHANEYSNLCCQVMYQQGIKFIVEGDFFEYKPDEKYDTLLLLMNGVGICGNLEGFRELLKKARHILKKGGQILLDSSDMVYLFENRIQEGYSYYGIVEFQYQYKDLKGDIFQWLYLDPKKMQEIATEMNYSMEILFEDDHYQFLAKLQPNELK